MYYYPSMMSRAGLNWVCNKTVVVDISELHNKSIVSTFLVEHTNRIDDTKRRRDGGDIAGNGHRLCYADKTGGSVLPTLRYSPHAQSSLRYTDIAMRHTRRPLCRDYAHITFDQQILFAVHLYRQRLLSHTKVRTTRDAYR